jgi:sugar phosphate isomerase/epimerase
VSEVDARVITPGLVSVTFRQLPPRRVVELTRVAGLGSIEWAGDVHVPHGDRAAARDVRRMTNDAGLAVSAYGSYYRAGVSESQGLAFRRVLDTAALLEAPTIRVWAGVVGSASADNATRRAIIADLVRVCDLAAGANVGVSLEFHADTLADTAESTAALLRDVARPNLTTFWQPPNGAPPGRALAGLRLLLPHVSNLHVFHWWPDHRHRWPLARGQRRWREYVRAVAAAVNGDGRNGQSRTASIEFVVGDSVEQFRDDAATLKRLVNGHASQTA